MFTPPSGPTPIETFGLPAVAAKAVNVLRKQLEFFLTNP
jgi:hypothetical protein